MTLEERIQKATDALFDYEDAAKLTAASEALRAAFPELFTDPPTAWLTNFSGHSIIDSHLSTLKGEKPHD